MEEKNFTKELRDKHCALFQSSPKLNRMLFTILICIQRKSSLFLSPVFTVSASNAWDHGRPLGRPTKKKTTAFLESRSAKASLTKKKRLPSFLHMFSKFQHLEGLMTFGDN